MSINYCYQCDSRFDEDYDLHDVCPMEEMVMKPMARKLSDIKRDINTDKLAETLIMAAMVFAITYYTMLLITN